MRELLDQELSIVSGGVEVVCTFQNMSTGCQVGTMPPQGLIDGVYSLYDVAVEATTDFFEWMFGDEDSP